jgi:hypothetical protein
MVIKSDSVLTEKTIVDNGEYDANQEGYDGYSKVNVGVTEFSKIDGVTYNINGINPVLENGRFWTKWQNNRGIVPLNNSGNKVKVNWAEDWELGYAVLMKNEIVRTERTISHGRESSSGFVFKAPVGFVAHTGYTSDPYAIFALRVSATTLTTADLWEPNTGFSEGMLPDTWYFVKASYNATTHTASITATKDFVNWSTAGSVTKADKTPYTGNDDYMCFAGQYPEPNNGAQNVILDLANCYIKQNGIIVWGNFDGKFSDKYTSQEAI